MENKEIYKKIGHGILAATLFFSVFGVFYVIGSTLCVSGMGCSYPWIITVGRSFFLSLPFWFGLGIVAYLAGHSKITRKFVYILFVALLLFTFVSFLTYEGGTNQLPIIEENPF